VVRNAPGLFNHHVGERDFGLFFRSSGEAVSLEKPAQTGETLTLLATGLGPYEKNPPEGFVLPESAGFKLADSVELVIGDAVYLPDYAGPSSFGAGMNAVRFRLGSTAGSSGRLTLKLRVNGRESNPVLLPVESLDAQ
jgi:uncharacterized protein (TIGR03437 family)